MSYEGYKNKESFLESKKKYREKVNADPEKKKARRFNQYRANGLKYAREADVSEKDLKKYLDDISQLINDRITK